MNAHAEASAATELGWYVYGVVDAQAAPGAAAGLAGVEGEVALVQEGAVAALVSRVPLGEYGEEPVRERLEDPSWLEAKARAHESVLAAALRAGAVVPFRLLTIYRRESDVRELLGSRSEELRSLLARVRGKVELGVKVFGDREQLSRALALATPEVAALDAEIETAPPGRAYLLRRRREQAVAQLEARLKLEHARACHAALAAAADDAVANPPQPPELTEREDEMLLNGAYLVPAEGERLSAAVSALEDEFGSAGLTFEITGPWPPYNFVPRDLVGA